MSKQTTKKRAAKKTVARRAWTKDDEKRLKTLAKEGRPAVAIAKALKRSAQSIYIRASANGISIGTKS
jgi:hypothetical protein